MTTAEYDTPTSYLSEELVVNELLSLVWSSVMTFPVWSLPKGCFFICFSQVNLSKLSPKNGNGFHITQHLCLPVFFIEANTVG